MYCSPLHTLLTLSNTLAKRARSPYGTCPQLRSSYRSSSASTSSFPQRFNKSKITKAKAKFRLGFYFLWFRQNLSMYPTAIYKIMLATEAIIRATPTFRISCVPSIKKNSPKIKTKNTLI